MINKDLIFKEGKDFYAVKRFKNNNKTIDEKQNEEKKEKKVPKKLTDEELFKILGEKSKKQINKFEIDILLEKTQHLLGEDLSFQEIGKSILLL